jgi:hypothetical protein
MGEAMSTTLWTRACATLAVALCTLAAAAPGLPQDSDTIQGRLDSAGKGGVVDLDAGNYALSRSLTFKSGVTLNGPLKGKAVLDASALPAPLTIKVDRVDGVLLRRLEFRNVILHVSGTVAHDAGRDVTLESCTFFDTKRANGASTGFILGTYATRLIVRGCTFLRSQEHHGEGVCFWRSHACKLENCRFGESGSDFPARRFGHFTNAVYVQGWDRDEHNSNLRCVDITLAGNTLRRSPEAAAEEDHGIYALGAKGLSICDNDISGWTTELKGGAIKARDGSDYIIRRNRCTGSGILLYNYDTPTYDLERVQVCDNIIKTASWDGSTAAIRATGISYWRADRKGTEKSIRIEDNTVENGVIVINTPLNAADFNADGGGVRRNKADAIILPEGVCQESNEPRLKDYWVAPSSVLVAPGEAQVDGMNQGILRVWSRNGLRQIVLGEVKVYAENGRELTGEGLAPIYKKGVRLSLKEDDGKVVELRLNP